jgi:Mg-chelatase subunit ChlD
MLYQVFWPYIQDTSESDRIWDALQATVSCLENADNQKELSMSEAKRAALSEYDFYMLIDKSGSMGQPVKEGSSRSRWQAVQESAEQFAREIGTIDTDGITVVMFGGSDVKAYEGVQGDHVAKVFSENRPSGSTPLAEALAKTFALSEASRKKDFILCVTDGIPDDPGMVAKLIKDKTNKMDADDECTILFIQVGDDSSATQYLRGLDDNLKGAKFDIVDVKTQAEAESLSIEDLLLNAIAD